MHVKILIILEKQKIMMQGLDGRYLLIKFNLKNK